jgi:hypothetical protein
LQKVCFNLRKPEDIMTFFALGAVGGIITTIIYQMIFEPHITALKTTGLPPSPPSPTA